MANVPKQNRSQRLQRTLPAGRPKPIPSGVVAITSVKRLPVGSTAVIVAAPGKDTEPLENIGKRVIITGYARGAFCICVDSLDGPLALDCGGRLLRDIRYRPANLRRLWAGLSDSERAKLALLRIEVPHG